MLLDSAHVINVDQRTCASTHDDADGQGNKHQTSLACRISLALLVNDWEPVETSAKLLGTLEHHISTYATKNMYNSP